MLSAQIPNTRYQINNGRQEIPFFESFRAVRQQLWPNRIGIESKLHPGIEIRHIHLLGKQSEHYLSNRLSPPKLSTQTAI